MKYSKEELLVIWLDSFEDIDYKQKTELLDSFSGKSDIKEVIERGKADIIRSLGETGYNRLHNSTNKEYLFSVLEQLSNANERAITIYSTDYPALLRETNIPPLVLYARGNTDLLKDEIIGVVGSRKSIPISLALAKDFSAELSDAGFTLCTGTAEGVDSEVIKATLNSGKIISVSASGFNKIYPASNTSLIDKVAECGLCITEHREDVQAKPFFFPIRNRIIAGISQGVLAVNGRMKSGVMHTAAYCLDYGRDLFAIPYSPNVESGKGTNYLIKNGANLVDSAKDILLFYGKATEIVENSDFSPEETEIINALKENSLHIEKLAEITGKQVYELTPTLTVLEIKGVIYKDDINSYGLTRNSEA